MNLAVVFVNSGPMRMMHCVLGTLKYTMIFCLTYIDRHLSTLESLPPLKGAMVINP